MRKESLNGNHKLRSFRISSRILETPKRDRVIADLSLVAISERLNIAAIATLDDDFYVYQRYRKQPSDRISLT